MCVGVCVCLVLCVCVCVCVCVFHDTSYSTSRAHTQSLVGQSELLHWDPYLTAGGRSVWCTAAPNRGASPAEWLPASPCIPQASLEPGALPLWLLSSFCIEPPQLQSGVAQLSRDDQLARDRQVVSNTHHFHPAIGGEKNCCYVELNYSRVQSVSTSGQWEEGGGWSLEMLCRASAARQGSKDRGVWSRRTSE